MGGHLVHSFLSKRRLSARGPASDQRPDVGHRSEHPQHPASAHLVAISLPIQRQFPPHGPFEVLDEGSALLSQLTYAILNSMSPVFRLESHNLYPWNSINSQ